MEFSKFFPVVLEIVISRENKQRFIMRHPNGNVMAILEQYSDIVAFVDNLCKDLVAPPVSVSLSDGVKLNSKK